MDPREKINVAAAGGNLGVAHAASTAAFDLGVHKLLQTTADAADPEARLGVDVSARDTEVHRELKVAESAHGTLCGSRRPLKVVAISDTHGMHRKLEIPEGDVLLHGGDFTRFGKMEDARDFNEWLGGLPHPHKFVVLGNHEANAPWVETASALLTNATLLSESVAVVRRPDSERTGDVQGGGNPVDGVEGGLRVFGTAFYWPVEHEGPCYFLPPYACIPVGVDILLTHGPPAVDGIDGGMGCRYLLEHVKRVRPQLVVCGHIHQAHGVVEGSAACGLEGVTLVNAANAGGRGAKEHSRQLGWPPVVMEL